LIGVLKGQRAEQNGVDDAEDGAVCSDSERQCDDGYGAESGGFQKHPERILQVFDHCCLISLGDNSLAKYHRAGARGEARRNQPTRRSETAS
jgi:hypothetical protein